MLFMGDDWAEAHHHIELEEEAWPAAGRETIGAYGAQGQPSSMCMPAIPDPAPDWAIGGTRLTDPRPGGSPR